MITYFPPSIRLDEQREIKHYTRLVETEGLFPGPRWVRHVEALYASSLAKTTTGKPDNSARGKYVSLSLWDAVATRVAPARLEWAAELSQRDASGHIDMTKPYLKAEADIFCHRSHPLGRDFMLSVCGALRERVEMTDRRGRIAKDIIRPEPCVVLIVYSEHQNVKDDRQRLIFDRANGGLATQPRKQNALSYCAWIDELIYGAQVEKINHLVQLISEQ